MKTNKRMSIIYNRKILKLIRVTAMIIMLSAFTVHVSSNASFICFNGFASWYADFSPGIEVTTANMEEFDHDQMTCAMWGLPFDTIVEVTNLSNGRRVFVRVNDRGPSHKLLKEGRVIDLTMAAFRKIEDLDKGLTKVQVRVIK